MTRSCAPILSAVVPGDGQTQPAAGLLRAGHAVKAFKQARKVLFAHSGAVVAQRNIAAERRQRTDIGFDAAAGRRILERVVQQVGEDGDQRLAIGVYHHVLAAVEREFHILFQRIGDVLRDAFANVGVDVHRLDFQRKILRLQLGGLISWRDSDAARSSPCCMSPMISRRSCCSLTGQQMQLRQHSGDRRTQFVRRIGHKAFSRWLAASMRAISLLTSTTTGRIS